MGKWGHMVASPGRLGVCTMLQESLLNYVRRLPCVCPFSELSSCKLCFEGYVGNVAFLYAGLRLLDMIFVNAKAMLLARFPTPDLRLSKRFGKAAK